MLKKEERQKIHEDIESEGFLYNFLHYTDYPEIEDLHFHGLREDFIEAAMKLADYICYDEL